MTAIQGHPLSVVVCTLDEAAVIERCLRSVLWADELLVVDSGSQDDTVAIARRCGARVIEQQWLGFSAQKNRAASLARNDWILSLDADEIVTPRLGAAIREVLAGPRPLDPADGYTMDRRGDFLGVVLPNGTRPGKRRTFVRLYNRTLSQWDETMAVHEVVHSPGAHHPLDGLLLHFNELTLDEFVKLFNRYAEVEAADLAAQGVRTSAIGVLLRPVLRFLWHYLARGEFRLGAAGAVHSGLKAMSDFIRYAKLWELSRAPRAQTGAEPGPEGLPNANDDGA